MQISEQEWIRQRAYALWESSGYHHGGDLDHWIQAQSEFESRGDDPSVDETIIAEVRAKPKTKARKT